VFTAESTSECVKYLLHESNFYFMLTRAFSSDPVETMFSNVRMGGGLHDVTDARTAHYALQHILKSGIVHAVSSASANISASDTSYTSCVTICKNRNSLNEEDNLEIDLPEYIRENIQNFGEETNKVGYGLRSASVAMLTGYIVRTLDERIDCSGLEKFTSFSACTPLLGLIHLQDRGSLRYPTRYFISLIHQLSNLVEEIVPYLKPESNGLKCITFLLTERLQSIIDCSQHKQQIAETILSKLVKPLLNSFGRINTENVFRTNLYCKPSSRKVLML
jgi:hypothetical protein